MSFENGETFEISQSEPVFSSRFETMQSRSKIVIHGGSSSALSDISSTIALLDFSEDIVRYQVLQSSGYNYAPLYTGVNSTPGSRRQSCSALNEADNQVIIFGGWANPLKFYSDLWTFNLDSHRWQYISGPQEPNQPSVFGTKNVSSVGNYPGGRAACISAFDPVTCTFHVFGGFQQQGSTISLYNQKWIYQFRRPSRSTPTGYTTTSDNVSRATELPGTASTKTSADFNTNSITSETITAISVSIVLIVLLLITVVSLLIYRKKKQARQQHETKEISLRDMDTIVLQQNSAQIAPPTAGRSLNLPDINMTTVSNSTIVATKTQK